MSADENGSLSYVKGGAQQRRHRQRRASDGPPASVVVVSAVHPMPTSSGKKVVLKGLLDYLVDRLGAENVHYLLLDDELPAGDLPCAVHLLGRPGTGRKIWNVVSKCFVRRNRTLQEALTSSPQVQAKLRSLLSELQPDLEIYDTLRMAQLIEDDVPDCRRVVYLDDLYSVRYEGMLKQMAEDPDIDVRPLGDFVRHIPGPLRRLGSPAPGLPPAGCASKATGWHCVRRSASSVSTSACSSTTKRSTPFGAARPRRRSTS